MGPIEVIMKTTLIFSNGQQYVLHIFPPCQFVTQNLSRLAPDFLQSVQDLPMLMVVITEQWHFSLSLPLHIKTISISHLLQHTERQFFSKVYWKFAVMNWYITEGQCLESQNLKNGLKWEYIHQSVAADLPHTYHIYHTCIEKYFPNPH